MNLNLIKTKTINLIQQYKHLLSKGLVLIIKETMTSTLIKYSIPMFEVSKYTKREYVVKYDNVLGGYHLVFVDDKFVFFDSEEYIEEIVQSIPELATLDNFKGAKHIYFKMDSDNIAYMVYTFERSSSNKLEIKL